MCGEGGGYGGGAHHKNQLNVFPFSPTETDILHIIALKLLKLLHL